MYQFEQISIESNDYQATLDLRNKVMRIPLGLSINMDDLSYEQHAVIWIAKREDIVCGVGVLYRESEIQSKIRFLCIDETIQKKGIGQMLLLKLEQSASIVYKSKQIIMDARVTAQPFYEKNGYQAYGEVFLMKEVPVLHIMMMKSL